jgi:hypothetical protein
MNLHELLAMTADAEILRHVCGRHSDDPAGAAHAYTMVLADLRGLAPDALSPGALGITDDEGWHEAHLVQTDGEHIGASLMPWTIWLAVEVPPALLEAFSAAVILADVLWDMTFYGFTDVAVTAKAEHIGTALDEALGEALDEVRT